MIEAFIWGTLAASSLMLGAILSLRIKISRQLLGLIMAFGVGVLISAISFELIDVAYKTSKNGWVVVFGMLLGAGVFTLGDYYITKKGGRKHRKSASGVDQDSGLAILLGTVLDGVPESIVIGLGLVAGKSVSVAMIVAVFVSNLPEAVSSTAGLKAGGWAPLRILKMWLVVVIVSGFSALAGYWIFDSASPAVMALILSFAGGALLTMIADTMMPEAYKDTGKLAGLVTTAGFTVAYLIAVYS